MFQHKPWNILDGCFEAYHISQQHLEKKSKIWYYNCQLWSNFMRFYSWIKDFLTGKSWFISWFLFLHLEMLSDMQTSLCRTVGGLYIPYAIWHLRMATLQVACSNRCTKPFGQNFQSSVFQSQSKWCWFFSEMQFSSKYHGKQYYRVPRRKHLTSSDLIDWFIHIHMSPCHNILLGQSFG